MGECSNHTGFHVKPSYECISMMKERKEEREEERKTERKEKGERESTQINNINCDSHVTLFKLEVIFSKG